ncbi:MAG: hypothetical protein OEZ43_19150 [Gammaproteobacteria bacterium]|nr:hypothetical protein [Gammaproteobacteria bacterium]
MRYFAFCFGVYAAIFSDAFAASAVPIIPGSQLLYQPYQNYIACRTGSTGIDTYFGTDTPCNSLTASYQSSLFVEQGDTRIGSYASLIQATSSSSAWALHGQYERLQKEQEYFTYIDKVVGVDLLTMSLQYTTYPNHASLLYDGFAYASIQLDGYFSDQFDGYLNHRIAVKPHPVLDIAWHRVNPRHGYTLHIRSLSNAVSANFTGEATYDAVETNIRWKNTARIYFARSLGELRSQTLRTALVLPRNFSLALFLYRQRSPHTTDFTNLGVRQGKLNLGFDESETQFQISWSYKPRLRLFYNGQWSKWNSSVDGELNDSLLQSAFDPLALTRRKFRLDGNISTQQHAIKLQYQGRVNLSAGIAWLSIMPMGKTENWLPGIFLLPDTDYSKQQLDVSKIDLANIDARVSATWSKLEVFCRYQQYLPFRIVYNSRESDALKDILSDKKRRWAWKDIFPIEGSVFETGVSYRF